ncbi:DUF4238 domain-containing protein [Pseudomonas chlororaphis subsp. aureofaciens]|uniref:DUF4238 domain-containing protein n=1 Tax=Pseudomonas chlororaphis TaxID=587753 RepID=UPI003558F147
MATNKNQHFVPRCYLKQFTIDKANAAINLFNIDRLKFIPNAPVKNQCSGDYFYGKDVKLEAAIQSIESAYGNVLKSILKPGYLLTKDHRDILRIFWTFQNLRTEAASKRAVEITDETFCDIGDHSSNFAFKIKEAVQVAMHAFAESMSLVDDLKVCLIKNKTNVPFITSDDPAILTNRWYIETKKTRGMSFGMRDAGALLLLPLTPDIYFICYDQSLYNISSSNGWLNLRNKADVETLNELQVLHCRANIFLQHENYAGSLQDFVVKHKSRRLKSRHQINYAVFDGVEHGSHKRYKVVDKIEFKKHEDGVIHMQSIHPRPSSWPSFLLRNNRGIVYYNGTGVGYVRGAHTADGDLPFRKVPAY